MELDSFVMFHCTRKKLWSACKTIADGEQNEKSREYFKLNLEQFCLLFIFKLALLPKFIHF